MNSLIVRLIAIFTVGILIILTGMAIGYTTLYERNSQEQTSRYLHETAENTALSLQRYLTDLEASAQIMTQQRDICDFAAGDINTRFRLRDTVRSHLSTYANYKTGIMTVYLACKDGAWISATPDDANAYLPQVFMTFLHAIQNYDLKNPFRNTVLTRHYRNESGETSDYCLLVPVYRLIAAPKESDYLGAFVILCDDQSLTSVLPDFAPDRIRIYDGDVCIFGEADAHDGSETAEIMGVSGTEWKVSILSAPLEETHLQNRARRYVWIMGSLSILVLGGLLIYTYRAFIHPVISISRQVQDIEDIASRITSVGSTDPAFRKLTSSINQMLERIERMTHEAASATENMYQARLLFLQAQINPHFLYNNLACIRGMAGLGDTNSIRQMTTCVADIYRYGAAGETTATLAEELECADNYMQIMELRYENRYRLKLDVQPEAMDWIVPRMMLQPLIENSILHGYLDAHIHEGTVRVQAAIQNDVLHVSVRDEGGGFSEEAISMLQGTNEVGQRQPHHLGIRNVRARIHLLFRDEARFEVQTNTDQGSEVLISIPRN